MWILDSPFIINKYSKVKMQKQSSTSSSPSSPIPKPELQKTGSQHSLPKDNLAPSDKISNKRLALKDYLRLKSTKSKKNLDKEKRNKLKTDETAETLEMMSKEVGNSIDEYIASLLLLKEQFANQGQKKGKNKEE